MRITPDACLKTCKRPSQESPLLRWTGLKVRFNPLSEYIMQKEIVTRKLTLEKLIFYPFSLLFGSVAICFVRNSRLPSYKGSRLNFLFLFIDFAPFPLCFVSFVGTAREIDSKHFASHIFGLLTFIIVLYKKSFATRKFSFDNFFLQLLLALIKNINDFCYAGIYPSSRISN